ncbi:MAG TPA: cupin domain-containing protein [Alphaproteobacteria bacterium]|nr:cupin domain-containing protein [Alphaproteobacteria bacterium]
MTSPRHTPAPEVAALPLEEIIQRHTRRFGEIEPDWNAFADSQIEGTRRAQYRFIGAGGSGKHNEGTFIPPGNFTLSIVLLPPGQGGSAHSHECEEAFFVLDGELTVFLQDEKGRQARTVLKKWECISCPAGVLHGFVNESQAPCHVQIMVGKGRPGPVGYADDGIYKDEIERTKALA